MVRLKAITSHWVVAEYKFQFLNGSIKSYCKVSLSLILYHFNSSMVRLKAASDHQDHAYVLNFNSSMVRLKAIVWDNKLWIIGFQFLNGSIKSRVPHLASPVPLYFNSSMVRLKAPVSDFNKADPTDFNSSMVRLKDHLKKLWIPGRGISIPQWFD